jgi:flagellar basal-body rod protein FlgC
MLFGAMDAAASGLTAERLRLDVIAQNLANVDTTVTPQGGPYREEAVVFSPVPWTATQPGGVEVTAIVSNPAPFPLRYDPGAPGADAQGFVALPNVNVTAQMVDLLAASRAYDANATAFADFVKEGQAALQL